MEGKTDKNEGRIAGVEISFASLKERTSNLAIFQSIFSLVIGAIATFIAYSLR